MTSGSSRPCCPSWPPSTASSGSGSPTSSRPRPGPAWSRRSRTTPGVSRYYDLSFQHASATVLRRMRRFGDPESFLGLLERYGRSRRRPVSGPTSSSGSPARPTTTCRRSATSWSRPASTSPVSSGTPTRTAPRPPRSTGKLDDDEIRARVEHVTDLVEQLTADRAEERIGEDGRGPRRVGRRRRRGRCRRGRADHQGPEVDGTTRLTTGHARRGRPGRRPRWSPTEGADLVAEPTPMTRQVGTSGNWNLPNVLTGIRILIVPFYGYRPPSGRRPTRSSGARVAAVLFFVAMVTDKVDGDIARSRGLVTDFGKIADPIADKAMTGMAFIGLSIVGDIWWCGHDRGAAPRVVGDPAPALDPEAGRGRGRTERQDQDRPPGRGADVAVAAAAPARGPAPRRRGRDLLRSRRRCWRWPSR